MLSSVLYTEIAITISIKRINAFVTMRKYISGSLIEQRYINNLVLEDHDRKNIRVFIERVRRKDNEIKTILINKIIQLLNK